MANPCRPCARRRAMPDRWPFLALSPHSQRGETAVGFFPNAYEIPRPSDLSATAASISPELLVIWSRVHGRCGTALTAVPVKISLVVARERARKIASKNRSSTTTGIGGSFQLANSAPPLGVTGSASAPTARMHPTPPTSSVHCLLRWTGRGAYRSSSGTLSASAPRRRHSTTPTRAALNARGGASSATVRAEALQKLKRVS